jgi:hypothetical protein
MDDTLALTTYEEHIYNTFLKTGRQKNKQPYKLRKDFTTLNDKTKSYIKKISLFLSKFKHIKVEDFFIAPYYVYADETYFDLEYFTTLKATKAYTLYQKQRVFSDPDSEDQLIFIRDSLFFIQQFCKDKDITIDEYLYHKDGITPSFLLHIKEHSVNIYTLLGFDHFTRELNKLDANTVTFIIDESLYNQINVFRTKLFASQKAKQLITIGLQRIEINLQKTC